MGGSHVCSASLYLTLRLCLDLGGDAPWVLVVIGLAFEAAKYAFSWERSLAPRGIVALLVVVSIAASLGHLLQVDQGRIAIAEATQAHRQELGQVIKGLEEDAALLRTAAAKDIKVGRFRTRGREVIAGEVAAYREQIQKAQAELRSLPVVTSASAGRAFEALGHALGIQPMSIRFGANALVAVLIEVLSLMALARLREAQATLPRDQMVSGPIGNEAAWEAERPVTKPLGQDEGTAGLAVARRGTLRKRTAGRGDTAIDGPWDSRFRRFLQLVESHQPGDAIAYGRVREELNASNRVVRRYFEELARLGLVQKQGRSWVRTPPVASTA